MPVGIGGRARSWTAIEAKIVSVDLETVMSTGHRGRSSTSLQLNATYEYQFAENKYVGTAISPFAQIELFRGYKRELASKLRELKRKHQPATCFVNVNNPELSYLNRDFRWFSFVLLFGITFLFAGCGFLILRQHST